MVDMRFAVGLSVMAVTVIGTGGCGSETESSPCEPVPNGCGPGGWLSVVVPECPLGLPCFTPACNKHDICYSTCGSDRHVCDAAFYHDMLSICKGSLVSGSNAHRHCGDVAYIYWLAVNAFGETYFEDGQQKICACDKPDLTITPLISFIENNRDDEVPSDALIAEIASDTPCPPFDDADSDWLPDEWESAVGLDPTDPSDAWNDLDNDGIVNLHEFIHGTDPYRIDADFRRLDFDVRIDMEAILWAFSTTASGRDLGDP
jgi:hypothetical protein